MGAFCMVLERGLEPPRAFAHYPLKVARLPIPPFELEKWSSIYNLAWYIRQAILLGCLSAFGRHLYGFWTHKLTAVNPSNQHKDDCTTQERITRAHKAKHLIIS